MAAAGSRGPASATPNVSRRCIFAVASAFSEIAANSVFVTNCASVSVTGGGMAILCSLELGYMKAPYLKRTATGNRQQRRDRSINQETKNERLFGRHPSLGAG